MRRRFLISPTIVAISFLLAGGCIHAETLDSLSEKMSAAAADTNSMSATIELNLRASLHAFDSTNASGMPLTASASIQTDYTRNPVAIKADGSSRVAILMSGSPTPLGLYAVTDEAGVMTTFRRDPVTGAWKVTSSDGSDLTVFVKSISDAAMSFDRLAGLGLDFELAPETTDLDGDECYLLSCTADYALLDEVIRQTDEKIGYDLTENEDIGWLLPLLDGMQMNIEYYVDTATFLPVRVYINLNDSDLAEVESFIGGTISLDDCSLDMKIACNTVDEIIVPDEVLAEALDADVDVPSVTGDTGETESTDIAGS